ncbi:MAG TPA: 3-phosphoshikimate 1-carboxyvinyltransferase [bacterium]|nr:3-phosphoshikimate 1-carboxyvinyltransferase [bacterium]
MNKIRFSHLPKEIKVLKFAAPGSKSITNRILIVSALTQTRHNIKNILLSEDTLIMLNALSALNINFSYCPITRILKKNIICGKSSENKIYLGYAGTVYRFLLAFMMTLKGTYILQGEPELHNRPITELVAALNSIIKIGNIFEDSQNKLLKVNIQELKEKTSISVNPKKSSQFLTALLLILPVLKNIDYIEAIEEPVSKTYIDLTLKLMKDTGVDIINKNYKKFYLADKLQDYKFDEYNVEGDFSGASYFFAVAAITGIYTIIENMDLLSAQGDKHLLDILKKMNCEIEYDSKNKIFKISRVKKLRAMGEIDMSTMQDVVPTLAVIALFAEGDTIITNIENLKYKECDRFRAIITELQKINADISYGSDWIKIRGKENYNSAEIDTYKDHRMAMAFSLLSLKINNITINEPEYVCKTFPDFFEQYLKLFEFENVKINYYSDIYRTQYELFCKNILEKS